MARKSIILTALLFVALVYVQLAVFFSQDSDMPPAFATSYSTLWRGDSTIFRASDGDTTAIFETADGNFTISNRNGACIISVTEQLKIYSDDATNAALNIINTSTGNSQITILADGSGYSNVVYGNNSGGTFRWMTGYNKSSNLFNISASSVPGTDDIIRLSSGGAFSLLGSGSQITTYASDGTTQLANLGNPGSGYGNLFLRDNAGQTQIHLTPNGTSFINGYLERNEVTNWDAMSFFSPADSGAVRDSLSSVFEVYAYYNSGDSTRLLNTWQPPPYFTQVDSFELFIETNNTNGDSACFEVFVRTKAVAEGSVSWVYVGADTIDLGGGAGVSRRLNITGFSGIDANDIVDFLVRRDNTISQNDADVVYLRRTRIHWQ